MAAIATSLPEHRFLADPAKPPARVDRAARSRISLTLALLVPIRRYELHWRMPTPTGSRREQTTALAIVCSSPACALVTGDYTATSVHSVPHSSASRVPGDRRQTWMLLPIFDSIGRVSVVYRLRMQHVTPISWRCTGAARCVRFGIGRSTAGWQTSIQLSRGIRCAAALSACALPYFIAVDRSSSTRRADTISPGLRIDPDPVDTPCRHRGRSKELMSSRRNTRSFTWLRGSVPRRTIETKALSPRRRRRSGPACRRPMTAPTLSRRLARRPSTASLPGSEANVARKAPTSHIPFVVSVVGELPAGR